MRQLSRVAGCPVEFEARESVSLEVVEGSSMREAMVEAVKHDVSLRKWKERADSNDKGFFWDAGL